MSMTSRLDPARDRRFSIPDRVVSCLSPVSRRTAAAHAPIQTAQYLVVVGHAGASSTHSTGEPTGLARREAADLDQPSGRVSKRFPQGAGLESELVAPFGIVASRSRRGAQLLGQLITPR